MTVLDFPTTQVERPEGCFSSVEVVSMADITYRQLDYWTRAGYVPHPVNQTLQPGSGQWRWFTEAQKDYILVLARLVKAGLRLDVAADVAKTHQNGVCKLDGDIEVRIA